VRETPCPFCENLRGRVTSDSYGIKKWAYIERQDLAAAFVNPFQSRQGAVLVVTTRHAPTILDLTEHEAEALARLVRRVARAVDDAFDPVGLNIFQNSGSRTASAFRITMCM
jgi:histidine triad (HIT) family protein